MFTVVPLGRDHVVAGLAVRLRPFDPHDFARPRRRLTRLESAAVQRANLFSTEVPRGNGPGNEPPGYDAHFVQLGPLIGSKLLGATIYELPPGQSSCPYHYEYGNEEWLIVIAGRPSLRHPDGEDELVPGDVVCFPEGPAGAHKLTNRTDEDVRFAILSTKQYPKVAVYPDSDKLAVWGLSDDRDNLITRRGDAVDYWDGET